MTDPLYTLVIVASAVIDAGAAAITLFARLERAVEGTAVTPLINEIRQVTVGDWRLAIGGVETNFQSEAARRLVYDLESMPGDGDMRVLLGHYPDVVLDLGPDSRIDLVVAGHTHGGQVQLPLLGPAVTLSSVPRRIGAGGLHAYNDNAVYVSRGVGLERGQAPRIRFLCPPEITLLEIDGVP